MVHFVGAGSGAADLITVRGKSLLEKADVITSSIKDRCDAIIADFRDQLGEEKKEMWQIRTKVLDFKKNVYDLYRSHIEELQAISVNELEDIVLPNESEIVSKIFTDVKGAIRDGIATDEKEREETDPLPRRLPHPRRKKPRPFRTRNTCAHCSRKSRPRRRSRSPKNRSRTKTPNRIPNSANGKNRTSRRFFFRFYEKSTLKRNVK